MMELVSFKSRDITDLSRSPGVHTGRGHVSSQQDGGRMQTRRRALPKCHHISGGR